MRYWLSFFWLCLFQVSFASANTLQLGLVNAAGEKLEAINHAVFFVVPDSPAETATGKQQKVVAQQGRLFDPYVTVIEAGTEIEFPNRDETAHHVYSFSKAKAFELPLYKQQTPSPIRFDDAGLIVLGCNIHDWMEAYILVVNTPHYQFMEQEVTRFNGLPAGDYTAYFWYPGARSLSPLSKSVSINNDTESVDVDFVIDKKLKVARPPVAPEFDEFTNDY